MKIIRAKFIYLLASMSGVIISTAFLFGPALSEVIKMAHSGKVDEATVMASIICIFLGFAFINFLKSIAWSIVESAYREMLTESIADRLKDKE